MHIIVVASIYIYDQLLCSQQCPTRQTSTRSNLETSAYRTCFRYVPQSAGVRGRGSNGRVVLLLEMSCWSSIPTVGHSNSVIESSRVRTARSSFTCQSSLVPRVEPPAYSIRGLLKNRTFLRLINELGSYFPVSLPETCEAWMKAKPSQRSKTHLLVISLLSTITLTRCIFLQNFAKPAKLVSLLVLHRYSELKLTALFVPPSVNW